MIIAIDGPAASGKGTLAKRIADHWGLPCLDTGLLYRAVARDVAARGFRLDDPWAALVQARSLDPATLGDPGPAHAAGRRRRLDRRPHPAGAQRPARLSAGLRRSTRRRRARRSRYRDGRLPRRRRQDLRHCPHRSARQTPFSRMPRPAPRLSHSRPSWPISSAGTSATPHAAAPPCGRPPTPTCSIPRTWI